MSLTRTTRSSTRLGKKVEEVTELESDNAKKILPKKRSKIETKFDASTSKKQKIEINKPPTNGEKFFFKNGNIKTEIMDVDDENDSCPTKNVVTNGKVEAQDVKKRSIKKEDILDDESEEKILNDVKMDDLEDEEAVNVKGKKKAQTTKKKPASKVAKKEAAKSEKKSVKQKNGTSAIKEEKKAVVRTFVKKGLAAVDGLCPISNTAHVYCEGDDIWDCLLNQTNIQFNNNKYYIIQLLKDDNKEAYTVWMRWGRVGLPGQNCLKPFGSNLLKAKETFTKKFFDKTKNEWELRDEFEKIPGKYDILKIDYSDNKDAVDSKPKQEIKPKVPKKKIESQLNAKVKALIELICDVKAMEEAVVEMKYDAAKAPLGKLTEEQVKAGYLALKKIDDIISGSGKTSNKDLLEACNSFYTRIPHYFGMKVPPMIRTKSEVQEKINLLQTLGDIQAAMNILNQPIQDDIHPADQHYNGLNCDIESLDSVSDEYKLLEKYLTSTHGSTHSMYKMKLQNVFKVTRGCEGDRFKDVGNRMLLWHGSRLTNWAGILSQGLRIAPPEAPVTGYMFGKGIYFADMSSKSANYCMPSMLHDEGLLVLCDVSLGKCNELINANYQGHKLPKGCHSVKGLGRTYPDPKNAVVQSDGSVVPLGPGISSPSTNKHTLQYNEFIVYDVTQVQIKYLLKIKFAF